MKDKKSVLLWVKNIALVCAVTAICWLGAKLVRVFTMFNTGGAEMIGEAEWEKMKSISTLDKTMIVVFIISIIIVIIVNKIQWKTK